VSKVIRPDPRPHRTRNTALAAARRLLLEEGLEAVTHLRVATAAGLGRKTIYRHWPTKTELLRDSLSTREWAQVELSGDLPVDLARHLEQLRRALVEGPLARILAAILERAAVDPSFLPLHQALAAEGVRPLTKILRTGVRSGRLPPDLDLHLALGLLEGPLFYRVLVLGERPNSGLIPSLLAAFLAHPPRRPAARKKIRSARGSGRRSGS
jgi:AcrR family transcriptional regulator